MSGRLTNRGEVPYTGIIAVAIIILVIAAAIYLTSPGDYEEDDVVFNISMDANATGDSEWELNVTVYGSPIHPEELRYNITYPNGTPVVSSEFPPESGVSDDNGLMWTDADGDGMLGTGDSIRIHNRAIRYGGDLWITGAERGHVSLPRTMPAIQMRAMKTGAHEWTITLYADMLDPGMLHYWLNSSNSSICTDVPFPTEPNVEDMNGVTWFDLDGDMTLNIADTIKINNQNVSSLDVFTISYGAEGTVILP